MEKKAIAAALLAAACFASFVSLSDSRPFLDEGVYVTGGWLVSQGLVPYADFFENKMPGIFFALAPVFGISAGIFAARLLIAVLGAVSLILIFFVSSKMFGKKAGIFAALFFALWAAMLGMFWAATEPFISLFSIPAFFFLWRYFCIKKTMPDLFYAGLFLGIACIFKQTMFLFAIAIFLLFFFNEILRKKDFNCRIFLRHFLAGIAGFAIPLLIVFSFFLMTNSLQAFYDNVFGYYTEKIGFFSSIAVDYRFLPVLLMLACLPLVALMKNSLDEKEKTGLLALVFWLVAAAANLFPLRGCCLHFITLLPPAAILSGFAISKALSLKRKKTAALAAAVFLLSAVLAVSFQVIYTQERHSFGELEKISGFIDSESLKREKIIVFPASPELYLISQRQPAVRQLHFFDPCNDSCRQLFLDDFEKNPPRIVVFFAVSDSNAEPAWAFELARQKMDFLGSKKLEQPLYNYYNYAIFFSLKNS